MAWSFWAAYLLKLAIVGLVLAASYAAAHALRRLRCFSTSADRKLRVLESAAISQHAAVHLVKAGRRYFLIGAAGTSIAVLAELAAADATPAEATR
ncbi:MAG: flagellar biosynthetic protein FliO [Candidatus Eremiobacteraeota bacterium]|nr:flagellar biosynthetic protein FliO [Candidatus Eremiobacteraeota bacterium]MBV8499659.1 flagellar biosynthetic protein FliO [Candidatus Eremiobacteraeota bacterium]